MKIVPVTERWNEGERDWSYVEDPGRSIAQWEEESGLKLPAAYRTFMLRYNGGRVYPRKFLYNIPAEVLPGINNKTYINAIYSWKYVESLWKGSPSSRVLPPQFIVFAGTPGEIELLMSLEPGNDGKVFAWVRSQNLWGTDGNDRVYFQADSFPSFLKSLFDEDDLRDYKSWRTPTYDRLARELEI